MPSVALPWLTAAIRRPRRSQRFTHQRHGLDLGPHRQAGASASACAERRVSRATTALALIAHAHQRQRGVLVSSAICSTVPSSWLPMLVLLCRVGAGQTDVAGQQPHAHRHGRQAAMVWAQTLKSAGPSLPRSPPDLQPSQLPLRVALGDHRASTTLAPSPRAVGSPGAITSASGRRRPRGPLHQHQWWPAAPPRSIAWLTKTTVSAFGVQPVEEGQHPRPCARRIQRRQRLVHQQARAGGQRRARWPRAGARRPRQGVEVRRSIRPPDAQQFDHRSSSRRAPPAHAARP